MAVLRWTIVVLGMRKWLMAIIYRLSSYPGSFYRENDRNVWTGDYMQVALL